MAFRSKLEEYGGLSMRQRMLLAFFLVAVAVWLVALGGEALCRSNMPETEETAIITGNDYRVLKDYFARIGQDRAPAVLGDHVKSVLFRALPFSFRKGCSDAISGWGGAAEAAAGMSVRVLHVDARKGEKTARVLLVYACYVKGREADGRYRDERLAGIVIDGERARLSMLPDRDDCDTCTDLTSIKLEKTAQIGGKSVVGVSFSRTNGNPGRSPPARLLKEENVRFYVMQERNIKPSGSVLKGREEMAEGAEQVKTAYSAGVVFKKDMRGNIIGILSPYRVARSYGRSGRDVSADKGARGEQSRGMVRYTWNAEREEFIKE